LPAVRTAALIAAMPPPPEPDAPGPRDVSPQESGALGPTIAAVGLVALAVITLASPGATRMYAWPWSLAYWIATLAPFALLILRALEPRRPWRPPSPGWAVLTAAWGALVVLSALFSPHRSASLLWCAPLLAGPALFLVLVDWLHESADAVAARRERLLQAGGCFLGVVALVGLGHWFIELPSKPDWHSVWLSRNPYPLGHANYTAGLALLMLPCFAALAVSSADRARALWTIAAVAALGLLFTSGSRGGFLGLAVLAVAATPAAARALRLKAGLVTVIGLAACAALFALNPRIREMVLSGPSDAPPNASDVQRTAMLTAGLHLGAERPLLGWGPGVTPLAYPRVRAKLQGGTESVLQLHSTPVQLWAELGGAGVLAAFGLGALALRSALPGKSDHPAARAVLAGLSGYLVFSLTDWQFDVPVFAAAAAVGAALLATPGSPSGRTSQFATVTGCFLAIALVGLVGRRDPTPGLNARALSVGQPARAIALLRESLELNPDQEIAHFNLGWLLVVEDPPAAERHFLAAARLVPDKGGVWFGLGLARLNQGNSAGAARAFALESLNDPAFLVSPWWKTGPFAALRRTHAAEFTRLAETTAGRLAARGGWQARESAYVAALTRWTLDRSRIPAPEVATGERSAYFDRDPRGAELDAARINAYRRQRAGYPVLVRRPDLFPPSDLFEVQENAAATGPLRFLFPPKGWLPSPLLLELLDQNQ
jgi:hypothetical protein